MFRLLQYSILLFLIANGLSAHLGDKSQVYIIEDHCEVTDNDNEADKGDDEERERNSREFLVNPERKLLRETVQNDAEPSAPKAVHQSLTPYPQPNYELSNWTVSFWDKYPKVSSEIKKHMHFSKRASDEATTA